MMTDATKIKEYEELYNQVMDRSTIAYLDLLNAMRVTYEKAGELDKCLKVSSELVKLILSSNFERRDIDNILLASYDSMARCGDFRAYCIALEWNRPREKQFFLPRKRILEKHGLIQAMQDVADDKLDFLFVSMSPRSGKSTLGIFFLTFMAGLHPDRSILANGHSTALAQSFYGEFLNIITGEEYRYGEIFPEVKLVNQNAEYLYVDLNSKKRFHTITVKSLSGGTTGLAEASNVLYCDDLIKDIEEANNPDRLDKIFHLYTSTIQDRTVMRLCKDGEYHRCPEIHIATRWSLHDVIGRLISIYGGEVNPRIRIVNIPCYDENGESNFMYDYGKGFTTEYYHQLQMTEDPVIFAAKYLGEPIERDGLVFTEDTLSYYNELPEGEPDRIIAYADPSHGGDDYFSFPIAYIYGFEIYIEDIWFENRFGGDDYSRPKVCNMIVKHKVQRVGIERNNGGDFYSTLIEQDLRKLGYRCNITTHNAPTNKSKQDRILAYQNEIKGIAIGDGSYRVYFKSKEARKKNKQYNEAMQQLFKWNQSRNMQNKQHDDFPDSLAGMLSNLINGKTTKVKTINASDYL